MLYSCRTRQVDWCEDVAPQHHSCGARVRRIPCLRRCNGARSEGKVNCAYGTEWCGGQRHRLQGGPSIFILSNICVPRGRVGSRGRRVGAVHHRLHARKDCACVLGHAQTHGPIGSRALHGDGHRGECPEARGHGGSVEEEDALCKQPGTQGWVCVMYPCGTRIANAATERTQQPARPPTLSRSLPFCQLQRGNLKVGF